jgi:hypothetical protein
MIEYSIGELKYYYSNYGDGEYGADTDYTKDDVESINFLEDTLSNAIDDDHINNNVYHIFPSIAIGAFAVFSTVSYMAISTFIALNV